MKKSMAVGDERLAQLLIDAVIDYAIYMLDPQGLVISWNAGAEKFKGYSRNDIIGQHFSRFYTHEDRADGLPRRALATAAREGRFVSQGWRIRKDGTRFWADVVIDAVRDPGGDLIGFAKITRDATQRKLAEDALRESEQRFRLLVQGITDYAVYMLDLNGVVSSWNPGAERLKGYRENEIVGRHFSQFYASEDIERGLPHHVLEIAKRDGRFESEGWRMRKDGSRFWAHVVIDPVYDDDGALRGFAKITRDITDRRKAEEALAETRARLFQAQKLEAIGQLTGGVAHDFNNLLTAVIGSLEMLRKRVPDEPRYTRLINNALQGATRGATLTQRMLAFARRQELRVQAVDVAELVRGMAELLQSSVGKTITIETRFPPRLIKARGDPGQLELAILNLVVNARDAMPDGGSVMITAREESVTSAGAGLEPGAYVCICVTDNGAGMDADTLARATEPFFTTKGVGRGTGLGLSMVHGLAEQSGGALRLTSQPGKGTTAEICLPVAGDAEIAATTPTGEGRQEAAPRGRSARVLVVDDDPLVLTNTAAMLDDLGHQVIEASSGLQALRILRRGGPIDLVITDHIMPGMMGAELATSIRAEWPDLPVVMATGYAEQPFRIDPDLPLLAKPFNQDTLAEAVALHARAPTTGLVIEFRAR